MVSLSRMPLTEYRIS